MARAARRPARVSSGAPAASGAGLAVSLQHRFPGGVQLDFAFEAPLPGVVAVFGASGAGKSSLLHCIAGFWRPDRSLVRIGNQTLCDAQTWRRPEQRRVGMVFQDARLFPHLTVAGNLRYGARRVSGVDADRPAALHYEEIVRLLGLEALLSRRPHSLSGGERQRVAIGRALLCRPLLLAMDEPLSGLDDLRRAEILPYLARLRASLLLPILYVTHVLDEVIRLADTLVLLRDGKVAACGPVASVLGDVQGDFAGRGDAAALFDGQVQGVEAASGLTLIQACGFLFRVTKLLPAGASVRLKIPAREVVLALSSTPEAMPALSVQNVLPVRLLALREEAANENGTVMISMTPLGGPGGILLAQVTGDSVRRLQLAPGAALLALVKSVSIGVIALEPS